MNQSYLRMVMKVRHLDHPYSILDTKINNYWLIRHPKTCNNKIMVKRDSVLHGITGGTKFHIMLINAHIYQQNPMATWNWCINMQTTENRHIICNIRMECVINKPNRKKWEDSIGYIEIMFPIWYRKIYILQVLNENYTNTLRP